MEYKYAPKSKTALIDAIRAEIKSQGKRADLNCIDTSAITDMSELFNEFKSFDGDISGWDVSNVTDMTDMFRSSRFSGDISSWNVDNVVYFFPMFKWCDIPEEHKPLRFRMTRDENSPALHGKIRFDEESDISFTLTGDGVLTVSGNPDYDLDSDFYRGLGDIPVRRLILKEGITEIGERMFYEWKNLEEVTFPESLTTIGDRAFEGCRNISQINFPKKGLLTIGSSAFSSCHVRELHLPETLTSIGSHAFSFWEQLEELTLPDSIVSVGKWDIFKNCTSLKSVKLPAHLKEITESMFSNCTSLEHVQMPEDLEKIDSYAFYDCPNLKAVELPDTLQCIAVDAFEKVTFEEGGLDFCLINYITNFCSCDVSAKDWEGDLDIPSSVCYGGRTFSVRDIDFSNCKNLRNVHIPDTVTAIQNCAFEGCTALRSIEIPSSVTSIGEEAFSGCTALRSIELPDTVTKIADGLFDGCWRLRNVRLGENTTEIGTNAFRGCEFLQHLQIPDSVKIIYPSAFEDCKNLVDINMPASLELLGTYALEKTPLLDQDGPIYIGNVLCGFGGEAPNHACLEVREGTTLVAEAAFRECREIESIIFPETLERIGYEAFNDCTELKHVYLPKSLKFIGNGAFCYTAISEVELPWETPIEADDRPFPKSAVLYVPVGASESYKAAKVWNEYKILEKENCGAAPTFITEDTKIIGRKETYRVILIETPQRKAHWNLYGVIVTSKFEGDPRKAVRDMMYECFRGTARFLDWEEDMDFGSAEPLSDLIDYKGQRFAVADLPEDATPETVLLDGKKYLTDEAMYKQLSSLVTEWQKLEE